MSIGNDHSNKQVKAIRGLGCLGFAFLGLVFMAILGVLTIGSLGVSHLDESGVVEILESTHPEAKGTIAIVEVKGVLVDEGSMMQNSGTAATAERMLKKALKDARVSGVVLVLDTPGGSVTVSDILYDLVLRIRKAGKPVVVLMGDICASGGYYIAAGADAIIAHPTSLTGSIGVLINALSAQSLMERYGLIDQSIVSGPNKQILSVTKTLSEEQRVLLQGIVDELYTRFVNIVAQGRRLEVGAVRTVADGRVLTATQAKKAKLIDKIGYFRDALAHLKTKLGTGPFNVVRYGQQPSFLNLLGGQLSASSDVRMAVSMAKQPRAYYLFGGLGVALGVQGQ